MSEEAVNEPYVYQDEPEPELQPTDGEPSEPTEEDAGAEPEPAEPTGVDTPAEPQDKEKGVQKRIDELTRKRREAEREAEYWKAKATGTEGATDPHREDTSPIPASFSGKPNSDQFDSYEDYLDALTDWKIEQRETIAKQREEQNKRQEAYNTHNERVQKAKSEIADYDEVLEDAGSIYMPQQVIDAIVESDHSALLLYHLAKNREEAEKIAKMPIGRQLKELGKIEARLEQAEKPVKRTTKAPDPITPVGSKEKVQKSPEDMSDDEWLEYERKRLAKLGRLY